MDLTELEAILKALFPKCKRIAETCGPTGKLHQINKEQDVLNSRQGRQQQVMKYLIVLIVAASLPAFGAESTNAPLRAELDGIPEAPAVSIVQIVQRLRRNGDGWLLNEKDRERLSVTLINQQGKVCAGAVASKVAPYGLLLEHESGAFWCGWDELPTATREKYQAIAVRAQKHSGRKTPDGERSAADLAGIANERANKQAHESAANSHDALFVKAKEELREVKTPDEHLIWMQRYWRYLTLEEQLVLQAQWAEQLKSNAAHRAGLKAIRDRKN